MILSTKNKNSFRRVWIVSAHFPPSNLASVHRARLLANHLADYGWNPTVLAVHPRFYEEDLDPDLEKLVHRSVRVISVGAFPQHFARPLGFGDIGIRGLIPLYQRLSKAIREKEVDLIHIMIPSNYQALLGRWLWERHRIPYIIDYIDPWIHESDLADRFLSKSWGSQFLAQKLEPIAVAQASGLSGVTEGYFAGVVQRNPHLSEIPKLAFQYGCSKQDHEIALQLSLPLRRIEKNSEVIQIIYAGAFLPKAVQPMCALLRALVIHASILGNRPIRLICLGTGKSPDDTKGYRVLPLARELKAELYLREYPERHPYLEVLATLAAADGIVIVGSTESHYSPSKLFQSVLSKRPILALLHSQSEAVSILKKSGAGQVITFEAEIDGKKLVEQCVEMFKGWPTKNSPQVCMDVFREYDISTIAEKVTRFYDQVVEYHHQKVQ